MAWYGFEENGENESGEKNQKNSGVNKAMDYVNKREAQSKILRNLNNGKATELRGRKNGRSGTFAGTKKSFYGNNKAKDYGPSSPDTSHTPSTNMFTSNKQKQPSSWGAYKMNGSSLRKDNIKEQSKWNVGSGKVEKGQSSQWENFQKGQGKENVINPGVQGVTSTYSGPVKSLRHSEGKFGQISENRLIGGDTKNIDLTLAPLPRKIPKILEPHLIGFENHGNTCYLNASLQALLGLPMMVIDAISLKYALDRKGGMQGRSGEKQEVKLVIPFLQIAEARQNKDFDKVNKKLELLKTELEQVDKQFIGNKMQDATEFLGRMMDSMKDNIDQLYQELSPDMNQVKALVTEKDDGSKVELPNIINSNFLSECEEIFDCLNCHGKESNRHCDLNFYCTLSPSPKPTALVVEDQPVQLQKLINNTFETNEIRERRCERCGHNAALTTNRLTRLPRVLVLHLKRYDYEQGETSKKISQPVSLPAKLNLTKFIAKDVLLPEPIMERLCRREHIKPVTPHRLPISATRKRSWVESEVTPIKFRGKTADEIDAMGDEDKLEYTLHMSMKSIQATRNNNKEDQDLAAAIQASLNETPDNRNYTDDNIFSDSPATANKFNTMDGSEDKVEAPKTESEEDKQIQEALELSLLQQDMEYMDETECSSSLTTTPGKCSSIATSPSEIGESSNNQGPLDNNNGLDEVNPGLPEHDYRLVSVVSHLGTTTSSGHYVADVYRFDQGLWFRYDDTKVTPISETNMKNNCNNNKNGYIFMYIQEALAQKFDNNKTAS